MDRDRQLKQQASLSTAKAAQIEYMRQNVHKNPTGSDQRLISEYHSFNLQSFY